MIAIDLGKFNLTKSITKLTWKWLIKPSVLINFALQEEIFHDCLIHFSCLIKVCCQGISVNNIETLCILFKRLSHTCRLSDVVPPFGRNPTESVWYFITYSTLFTTDLLTSLVLGTKILYIRTTWNYIANQEPHCKIALGVLKEKFYIYLVQR